MTIMIIAGILGFVVGMLDRRDEERRSRALDQWYAENERYRARVKPERRFRIIGRGDA